MFDQAELAEFVLEEFTERTATPSLRENEISLIGFRDREPSPGVRWLLGKGEDFRDSGDPLAKLSEESRASQSEAMRRYFSTAKGKAAVLRAREKTNAKARAARRARRAARHELV